MQNAKLFYKLIPVAFLLFVSCKKWDLGKSSFPLVITGDFVPGIYPTKGKIKGEISGLIEGEFVDAYGHVWSSETDQPSIENNMGIKSFSYKIGNEPFESDLDRLGPGETYYYRAFLEYGDEVRYGEVRQFPTNSISPILKIDSIIPSLENVYQVRIYTTIKGLKAGQPLESFGITWGEDPDPDILNDDEYFPESSISEQDSTFQFSSDLLLSPGITYLRPFLIVGNKLFYGDNVIHKIQDVWVGRTDFGGHPLEGAVAFSIGDKGYIGTGYSTDGVLKDFWEYDPSANQWMQKMDFKGEARSGAVGFSIEDRGYIGTGSGMNGVLKDFWEYDPSANQWMQKMDFKGEARSDAVGFSIGGMGYIGTGSGMNGYLKDFWEYDPTSDLWTPRTDFGGGLRQSAVGFSIGDRGYIGTGSGMNGYLKDFWEYDPTTYQWTPWTDFGGGLRQSAVGFSIGDRGYIGTGYDNALILYNDFWEYDPNTHLWTQREGYPGNARYSGVGFSIGNRGYMGTGGNYTGRKIEFWEYVPEDQ